VSKICLFRRTVKPAVILRHHLSIFLEKLKNLSQKNSKQVQMQELTGKLNLK
jgi:hypothetical protein